MARTGFKENKSAQGFVTHVRQTDSPIEDMDFDDQSRSRLSNINEPCATSTQLSMGRDPETEETNVALQRRPLDNTFTTSQNQRHINSINRFTTPTTTRNQSVISALQITNTQSIPDEITSLHNYNENLKSENKRLKRQVNCMKQDLDDLKKSTNNFRDEVRRRTTRNHDREEEMQRRINELERRQNNTITDTRQSTTELEEIHAMHHKELEDLRNENRQLNFENEELKSELEGLKIQMQHLEERIKHVEEDRDQANIDYDKLKEQADRTEEDLLKLKKMKQEEDNNRIMRILLGEIAFKFDKVVVERVFVERFSNKSESELQVWKKNAYTLKIQHLVENRVEPPMNTVEKKRFHEFLTLCNQRQWGSKADILTRYLKELRGINRADIAHAANLKPQQTRDTLIDYVKAGFPAEPQYYVELIEFFCDYVGTPFPLKD